MRYPASEKLEIIRLVEQSHLTVRRTLATLGILPGTFYRWYDRLQSGGPEALEDRSPRPRRVWNRIPDDVREQVLELALDEPELSPRELATRFTDLKKYFCVGGIGLSAAQGTRPDHQPGLHRHEGCPCRELHPVVFMMKSAEDRRCGDVAEPLDRANKRYILTQG